MSSLQKIQREKVQPSTATKLIGAGIAACIADIVTFPLDTAKVRLQIQGGAKKEKKTHIGEKTQKIKQKYKGMFRTIKVIAQEEGAKGLYKGIVPGLQRQMCFAPVRVGCYDEVKRIYMNLLSKGAPGQEMTIGVRLLSGMTTGALSVCFAQPTDVVKIRMQAQTGHGPYTSAFQSYKTIARTEGIRGLWKGCFPNMTRNALVNVGELVTYDIIKEKLIHSNLLTDGVPCHFVSAFGAGFCATCVASPVDVVKTTYMNSKKGQYKGAIDCALSIYRNGRCPAFYKGFVPSFMRIGIWNIVMFISYEQIKQVMTPINLSNCNISEVL